MEIYNDTYCVYVHTNKINGKKYVGQTMREPEKRWCGGYGYEGCTHFWRAIKKYGWDNFEHDVVASNLTKSEADQFETLLIDKLMTCNNDFGYNLTSGGEGISGYHHTEESRQKMSQAHKGKIIPEETRRKISENSKSGTAEVREKISSAIKGIKRSDETKRKIGEASTGRNVGRKHTDAELEKMRKSRDGRAKNRYKAGSSPLKGTKISEERKIKIQSSSSKKSVWQKNLDGSVVGQYNSLSNASRATGINLGNISSCCNGHIATAGGFIWEFVD